jgi:mannan endo-1,4-beta-mannosidase
VTKLEQGIAQVGAAKKVYLAGEYDWTGLNGGTTPQGDSPADFYHAIEAYQASKDPVITGDLFWSLFMHNVPDCSVRFCPSCSPPPLVP